MNLIQRIRNWWQRPPAEQRVLDAMSPVEWRRGIDLAKSASVGTGCFYSHISQLEADGWVESKWEDGPIPPERLGHRHRLYRRKIIGVRYG